MPWLVTHWRYKDPGSRVSGAMLLVRFSRNKNASEPEWWMMNPFKCRPFLRSIDRQVSHRMSRSHQNMNAQAHWTDLYILRTNGPPKTETTQVFYPARNLTFYPRNSPGTLSTKEHNVLSQDLKEHNVLSQELTKSRSHEIGVYHVSVLIKSEDFVRSCEGLPFMQIPLAFSILTKSSLTASVSFAVRSSQLEVTYAAYACSPISGTHASKESSATWRLKQLSWHNLISIKPV